MSLLVLENLVKKFGGLLAVDHVNFSVDRNDIVGLIGPNGANGPIRIRILSFDSS